MNNPAYKLFFLFLLAPLLCSPVLAARLKSDGRSSEVQNKVDTSTADDSGANLEEMDAAEERGLHVLIEDGRIEKAVGEVERTVTSSAHSVVEADRLRHSFISLPDVIEQEVGVQTRAVGGEGSLTTVILRGASSEQVIIYLDGVPLNDASGGPVDLSFIPVESIERIEIYRGSTPLELGHPSIGGAVNIITRHKIKNASDKGKLTENLLTDSSRITASVASFQTYKLSASTLLSSKQDNILLTAGYLQSDNNFSFLNDNGTEFNVADDRVEKRQNDGIKQLALLANWKHRFSHRYDSEVRLDLLDREKEIPSVTNSAAVRTSLDTRQYNFLGQMNVHDLWSGTTDLNMRLFASSKTEVFDDSLAQIGFFNQHTESITRKLGTQIYAKVSQQAMQWSLLSSLSHETYDSQSNQQLAKSGRSTRDRLEVSAENKAYLNDNRLIFSSLLRYQLIDDALSPVTDNFGVMTAAIDRRYQFVDPQIGMKYRFNKQTYAIANIGIYNRAPSFFEIFGGGGLVQGNAGLKQETSLNTDLGLTYTWFKPYSWLHDTEVYGGVFFNQVDDLIVRIYNGQGIGKPENISDAVIQGLESTLKIIPSRHHTINADFTYIDSSNQTDITSFKNKALPGYYRQSYGLRYSYALTQWLFSFEADIKNNMFYDRSNLLKGDDVTLLNLGVRRYFQHSTLDFRLNNLLDENIQYFRNRPTPGLNASLTYSQVF